MNMDQLEANLREEIRDEADELFDDVYPEDRLTEMVDGSVPIYNSDLMDLAASDYSLALDEPDILAFDGTPTPINAIAGNVYERLSIVAHDEWGRMKTERQEELDYLEEIRESLEAENISMGELVDLQSLVHLIDKDDVQLLEAAGVPEAEYEKGLK